MKEVLDWSSYLANVVQIERAQKYARELGRFGQYWLQKSVMAREILGPENLLYGQEKQR